MLSFIGAASRSRHGMRPSANSKHCSCMQGQLVYEYCRNLMLAPSTVPLCRAIISPHFESTMHVQH